MKYKYIVLISAVFLLFLSACNTSKRILLPNTQKALNLSDVYEQVLKNQPNFTSMDISKLSLTISIGEQSFNIKGYLRIITDSVILISAQPIAGIEVGRVFINPDSLVVLDRMNALYYSIKMDSLKLETGIDFNTIQSLLSNQVFLSGIEKEQMSKKMFEVYSFVERYDLKGNEDSCNFNQNFIVNSQLRIEKAILVDKIKTYSLSCEYADFIQIESFNFPQKIKLVAFNGQKSQNIEIYITKVEFDKPVNINFSIPEKYTKGDIGNFKF